MTKDKNFEELTEEELEELIQSEEAEDLKADETLDSEEVSSEDAVVYKDVEEHFEISKEKDISSDKVSNSSSVREEIEVKSLKDQKKLERERKIEERRLKIAKERMIKQHRRAIKKNPEKLIRYDTDIQNGLSLEIVEKRVLDNLVNDANTKKTKSIPKIILTNFITFFNILTFVIAGILISVKAFTDLTFLAIVLVNITIGTIQEIRAKKTIDRLSLISAPTAVVRRAGVNHEIAVTEVVLDDLLLLENGKQICADSIVVDGQIEVNESLLTGESDAVIKKPGDVLYSGSFVVSGKCSARVDKVGKDNYIEQLTNQAKKYKKPKSDLLMSLTWLIRVMAVVIIPIGLILFYIMYFKNGLDYVYAIRKTAGAMIGMIPSGLFLMTSIALAVGVIRLSQRNVLVQELYCIEMLARVNCICLDKTGTITDGTMSVKNVVDYNTVYGLATKNIISAMLNALQDTNLTSVALEEKFGLGKRMKHVAAIPFSSQRKYQAVTFDKFGTFILGAPEFVLKEKYNTIQKDVNKYAALGYRVLCLAHREGIIRDGQLPDSQIEVISMILIEDNIRPDAVNTIRYFKESGVQVKVISGDNPITVSKISQRAGIENAEEYISLDGLSDSDVAKAATKYTVFGRVSPAQKRLLIQTLKENEMTVAMTGDGVNDILALKEADCSIAVASGSEAARNVSHLVLLDSNFDSMPKVVAEGRRVINNITSVASLFLTKTIFSLFLAIQALQTGVYPISTNQLILIDTLAIGLPSLFLVMEPNNNEVQGKFLFNVIKKALPGAIVILVISIVTFALSDSLGLDNTSLSTVIVIAATHTCLMVLFKTCKPFTTLRRSLCTLCYTLFIFFITVLPQFLEFRPIFAFAEYYSPTLTNKVITSYPNVEISKDNYYIIDGVVTSVSKNPNDKSDYFVASLDSETHKYYYTIKGDSTATKISEVVIPDISYGDDGRIYLGGFKANVNYSDIFTYKIDENNNCKKTQNFYVDENGYLFQATVTFDENGEMKVDAKSEITITLPKNRNYDYYGHNRNYGTAKDNVVQYRVMPTVEISQGELIINGKGGEEEIIKGESEYLKYRLPEGVTTLEGASIKIDPKTLQLLINGKVVNKVAVGDDNISKPYVVSLPTFSTNANNPLYPGALYIGAIDSSYTIYEVYGESTKLDSRTTKFVIYDELGRPIEYVKSDKESHVSYLDKHEYIFSDISSGFQAYFGKDGNKIQVYNGDESLSVVPSSTVYQLTYGETSIDGKPITYPMSDDKTGRGVSINETSICPDIAVTEAGHYIINSYYTNYIASTSGNLNPRIDDNYNLVLGEVVTDYKIPTSDVTTQKGGMVKPLTVEAKIFCLMLCLISAPLMKVLQGLIPWIIKQIKLIQKLLSKF